MAQRIDTSAFIARERQQLNLDLLPRSFPAERIALAVITGRGTRPENHGGAHGSELSDIIV